ncbi:lysylphosphatidylglycerol synthase transmembrane domain-containing protein [Anaeromyxobacter oryzisoli]|uniref:lysylphosphatidylglycerol synthase transmembrane domain-containing protein n=1 Tax=Anaeromyxobacter oryzisoli TaxID=2925408 RepID=UPI001F5648FE|nr:lysylphosphatidylglycerol synthase transmembrane domain-containing protein [Anaeromyxobacter sp. SG63]
MKRVVQAVIGLGISALALWFTLRGKDLDAVTHALRQADYRYLWLYLPFLAAIHLSRTVRWGILLEPVAKVPFGRLNAVSAVGFMALAILPFRLGELARPYLVAERPRIRVSAALSSVVVERVADGIFTGLLLVVSLLVVPDGTPGIRVLRVGGVVVSAAFVAALVFLVVAYRNRALAVSLVTRALAPLSPRLAARAGGMLEAFIQGLRLVPSRGKVALFFLLTAVYWGVNAWGMQVLARGFGFQLDAAAACTLLGVLVVGVMIPAGPGMVGTFQGAIVLGLALFAPRETVATHGVAYANVLWAAQLGFQAMLGLAFLFSRHVRLGRIFAAPAEVDAALEVEQAEYRADG